MEPIFKRIVLKLSGEALAGDKGSGIDGYTIKKYLRRLNEFMT